MGVLLRDLGLERVGVVGSGQIGPDIALHFAKSLADHYLVMSRGEIIQRGLGKNMDSENVRACLAL